MLNFLGLPGIANTYLFSPTPELPGKV
jgi:hypothetical protein